MNRSIVIGVDVGGTFTDILALDETSGEVRVAKVPSTRGDQSAGFLSGIQAATDDLGAVSTIIHGTTVATNALLERKGARAGIITTSGFRDVLEMRRRDRPTTWGLWGQFTPVIERQSRLEVAERTLASGEVTTEINPDEIGAAAADSAQSPFHFQLDTGHPVLHLSGCIRGEGVRRQPDKINIAIG